MLYGYSNGLNRGRGKKKLIPPGQVNVALIGAAGTVTADAETGVVTANVTAPAHAAAIDEGHPNGAGWFERTLADLQQAPELLAAPRLTGGTLPGETLTFTPAVWLAGEKAANVFVSFDLEADTGAGYSVLPGYDDETYGSVSSFTIDESNRGNRLRLRESALGATTGTRVASSAPVTVPVANAAPLPTLVGAPINQDLDLSSSGTAAETATAVFPTAGRYLLGVVDLTDGGVTTLAAESAVITSATPLGQTSGSGNTHVHLFLIDVDGAGDLTLRNTSAVTSYARQIILFDGTGLTDDGLLFMSATGGTDADPLALTFANAPAGCAALALGICRAGDSSVTTWGGAIGPNDKLSDAAFTNAAHRASSAAATVPGGDFTLSVAFDDDAADGEFFALATVLLAADVATPVNAHPGFLKDPAQDPTMSHTNGWGRGDHYTFEVDPTNEARMVIEPGETTRVWYMADPATGSLTRAEIESAEGLSAGTVTEAWLKDSGQNTGDYGLRSDKPLDWNDIGRNLIADMTDVDGQPENEGHAIWVSFAQDAFFDGSMSPFAQEIGYFLGVSESPMHPQFYKDHVRPGQPQGARPVFDARVYRGSEGDVPWDSVATQGIRYTKGIEPKFKGQNLCIADCQFDVQDDYPISVTYNNTVSIDRITIFASNVYDAWRTVPGNGTSWDANSDRISGIYLADVKGPLQWRTFIDHAGWQDGFADNGDDYPPGQPFSYFNHNTYYSENNEDVSFLECLSTQASFSAYQGRAGGMWTLIVGAENNFSGNLANGTHLFDYAITSGSFADDDELTFEPGFTGVYDGIKYGKMELKFPLTQAQIDSLSIGDTITGPNGTATYQGNFAATGNYGLLHSWLAMGAACKQSYFGAGVDEPNRTGNITRAYDHITGVGHVVKQFIAANGIDPHNPAEPAVKDAANAAPVFSTHTNPGINFEIEGRPFKPHDYKLSNWGAAENDHGVDGLNATALEEVTIGGYVDIAETGNPIGTRTTRQAIDWLRANHRNPGLKVRDIWNFAAARFGYDTVGHAPGQTITFTPDPDTDGYRADNRGNWPNGDYPVDGDNLRLAGNAMYSFMTFRLADLDFGAGGGLRLYGGLISCDTSQGSGLVELRNAAKFRVKAGTQSATYDVQAIGGRYEVDGTVTGVSGDFSGTSQCIVYGGGALTIAAGESLVLSGERIKCGFDGQGGASASLTLAGTLTFVAGETALPKIRKVRTGRFGLADLGGGVEGQPVAPDVTSSVALGGALIVNVSGLAAGGFTLIEADTLTGDFASVTVTGGSGTVSVDPGAGRVTITVD